jgi:serine/threonine protein kinase
LENNEHSKTVVIGETAASPSGNRTSGQYAPGDVLGGTYKIMDFLGQGGMGFVYRVEHLLLAKELALKVLRTDQVSEVIWRRFQTEAQAIARLDHANIVKIYDMNQTQDGVPYYTMDLLAGESLADYLDQHDFLPVEQALPIFRQICAGLAYAHDRGIIHRDIKPPNIMLLEGSHRVVKIVDFGIAKLSVAGQPGQGLTRPGEVFGSPLYMSPEQCLGSPIDHRTDIYSTGITFFEALTGRAPFIGRSAVETTAMHQSEPAPSLKDIGEMEYPPKLERIIAKMLAKAPEQRYQSLADTAKDLLLLERSLGQPSHKQTHSSKTTINLETDSSDQWDDGEDQVEPSLGERIRSSAKPLTVAVLVLAAAALLTNRILAPAPRPAKTLASLEATDQQNKNATRIPASRSSATTAESRESSDDDEFARQLAHKQDPLFLPEIGPNKPLFSKVIGKGASKFRQFTMPTELNLGTIEYGSRKRKQQNAQGTFTIPENETRKFYPSQSAATHSKIFKRFQDGDFQTFDCKKTLGAHDDLIENISHINSITNLQMSGNDFSNSSVKYIDRLTNLTDLGVAVTAITSEALAESSIPMRLRCINLSLKDASALIKAMRNSKKATHLTLERCHIDGAAIEALSTMPNLEKLEIGNNNLSNEDLKPLTKLKKLRFLELQGCRELTAEIIPTLSQIDGLKRVKLSLDSWSPQDQKRLKQALLPCEVLDHDRPDESEAK